MAKLATTVAIQVGTVNWPVGTDLEGKNLAIYLRKRVGLSLGMVVDAKILPTDKVIEVFNLCGQDESETLNALAGIVLPPKAQDDDTPTPTVQIAPPTKEELAQAVKVAGNVRDHMVLLASQLDEGFNKAMDKYTDGKESVQEGVISWLGQFARIYGGRSNLAGDIADHFATADWLDKFPVPGSEQEKGKNGKPVPLGNKQVEWYYAYTTGENGAKQVQVSAYSDWVANTTRGKAWKAEVALIDLVKTDKDKAPVKYRKMRDLTRAAERTRYTNKLDWSRGCSSQAIKLGLQLRAINAMPLVGAKFVLDTDDDGNDTETVKSCKKPIVMFEKVPAKNGGYNERNAEARSVGYVLSIDVDKAISEGGKLADVNNNAGRDSGDNTKQTGVKDMTDYITRKVDECLWLQDSDNYEALITQLSRTKGDARDKLVLLLGDVIKFDLAIWKNIEGDYERLYLVRKQQEKEQEDHKRKLAASIAATHNAKLN